MPRTQGAGTVLRWGVAGRPLQGQKVSGDMHFVRAFPNGALAAVVDGVGHGEEAAEAAQIAVATLRAHAHESVLALMQQSHEALKETRGVVMSLASFNALYHTMTWTGVGNVEAVLLHSEANAGPPREYVLMHGGVVGLQLPPLRAFVIPVVAGDTLVFATDGIRSGFAEGLALSETPQQIADRILLRDNKGTDDALVLVVRYVGAAP